ncbi:hypothetical protein HG531_011345 [Fusarium graminearum]|nr:hypothetical protein HG531_011345 [Fusarium graminearum]
MAGAVHDNPAHHAGSKLEELLDVNLTDERDLNTGVQFATNEPIIQNVARVTSGSKLAVLLVAMLDAKASNVNECRNEIRVDNVGGKDLDKVLRHKGPDREFGALGNSSGGEDSKSKGARVQG